MKLAGRFPSLSLLFVTATWGLGFPVTKIAIEAFPPITFVGVRFLIGSFLLAVILSFTNREGFFPFNKNEFIAGAKIGVCLYFGYLFQTIGLLYTSASNAGFITGLSVVLVPFLSVYFDRAQIHWNSWMGVGLSLFGLGLLSLSGHLGVSWGDLLELFCAFAFAFQIYLVGKFSVSIPPAHLAWTQVTVCGVLSSLTAMFYEKPLLSSIHKAVLMPSTLYAILICAVIGTAFAFIIQVHAQKRMSAVKTALILTLEPAFGALFAYIITKETLTLSQVLGCFLMLGGMLFSEIGDRNHPVSSHGNY